ncbi:glycosyltransferase family A protein [Desulfovibrio sp. ZJ200]|uniref:glycosyltransferase family 2 protein n=1 Tax=Desulfovibrio sp. ZJ200 TaxID=2709792 RepID=UPI001F14E0B5|nr:glycosyltransferase family A protein [Desulfovibrio sp. ZJ200]
MPVLLSIIVVTIDRLRLVERLFLSLAQQTCGNFEVLLMHAAKVPQADVAAVCRRFPELTIRAFPTPDTCLSRSRNAALPHIRGELFCIADDDCVYEPDTVARVLEQFRRFPDVAALTGTAVGLDESVPPAREGAVVRDARWLFQGCPSYVHFYRTRVLDAVHGFDEELGLGSGTPWQSGEETDFLLRTAQAGFGVMRAPAVRIRHPRPNLRELPQEKIRAYAAGRMRLLRKHGCSRAFVLANVVYPLAMLPCECLAASWRIMRYRWAMFWERLRNLRGAA